MSPRRTTVVMLSFVLGATAITWAPSARAVDDDASWRGDCGRSSNYRLRVLPGDDNGRFSVVGVVLSDDEDLWEWRMKHNDDISAEGKVKAKNTDRSFRIERTMIDLPGPDTILFMARNTQTGEVCRTEQDF